MNFNNNRGITLVALVVTIIVMLIIAGVTIFNGTGVIKEAKTESIKTNMLLVQAQIKNYVEQAKFERKTQPGEINGITVDGVTLKIKQSTESDFYEIDISDNESLMSDLGLGGLSPDDYLIKPDISNLTVDVYYVLGITDADGNTYYKLSDMH